MGQPVLLAIDDDPDDLDDVERELHDRSAPRYRVVCLRSPEDARSQLEEFAASDVEVALVPAGQMLAGVAGGQVLVASGDPGRRARAPPADGARPNTDWLPPDIERDQQGFILTGADVSQGPTSPPDRSPMLLDTSMPGVFAAGDVRHGAVTEPQGAPASVVVAALRSDLPKRGVLTPGRGTPPDGNPRP